MEGGKPGRQKSLKAEIQKEENWLRVTEKTKGRKSY